MRATDNPGVGIYKGPWAECGGTEQIGVEERSRREPVPGGDDGTMQERGQVMMHGARDRQARQAES